MKTVEFDSTIVDGAIRIPPEIVRELPSGEPIQWDGTDDDTVLRIHGQQRFEAAYADEDSIYEQLIDETPAR